MRTYEVASVFRHGADIYQKGLESVRGQIQKAGGTIRKEEDLGERPLAYPIQKETIARYMIFHTDLDPARVSDLENGLKLETSLLRFLVILSEED